MEKNETARVALNSLKVKSLNRCCVWIKSLKQKNEAYYKSLKEYERKIENGSQNHKLEQEINDLKKSISKLTKDN